MAPTIGRLALNNGFHGSIPGDWVAPPPQNIHVMLGESQEMPALHFSQRVADDLFESVHHPTDVQIAVPTEGGSLQARIFPVFAPGNTAGKLVLLDISHIVCDVVYGWDRCGINSILHEMNAPCPVSQVYLLLE